MRIKPPLCFACFEREYDRIMRPTTLAGRAQQWAVVFFQRWARIDEREYQP
jgi:hypothetical protein